MSLSFRKIGKIGKRRKSIDPNLIPDEDLPEHSTPCVQMLFCGCCGIQLEPEHLSEMQCRLMPSLRGPRPGSHDLHEYGVKAIIWKDGIEIGRGWSWRPNMMEKK